jgi:phosphatidylserine synthase
MTNMNHKDDFLGLMSFASLCCFIFFEIVRRLDSNKFLMVIAFILFVSTILILLEVGIRKYTQKDFNIPLKPLKYFSLLFVNTLLAFVLYVNYL